MNKPYNQIGNHFQTLSLSSLERGNYYTFLNKINPSAMIVDEPIQAPFRKIEKQ